MAGGHGSWVQSFQQGKATLRRLPASKYAAAVRVPRVGTGPTGPPAPPAGPPRTSIRIHIVNDAPERLVARPGVNREAEKDRLARINQFGRQNGAVLQAVATGRAAGGGGGASSSSPARGAALPTMREQIWEEVAAREAQLAALRRGDTAAEAQLRSEISHRLAELQRLGGG